MASYHCSVKVGGKGKAAAHAAYISREGKYSGRSRYEDLESTGHGNMPQWAEHNPANFWTAADEHERANGATYREIEVALPRELNPAQRRALVEDFIAQEIGDRHAYQWAIHTPKAALEKGEQPHAHIMYSERTLDGIERDPDQYFKRYNAKNPERGGCRKDSAGTEDRLQATRELWAAVQNDHLGQHGHAARVDHRSLKEQGIERSPEKHIGASRVKDMQAGDVAALLERRAAEGELERAQKQVGLIDLSGDLQAALRERDQARERQRQAEQEQQRQADPAAVLAEWLAQPPVEGRYEQSFDRWGIAEAAAEALRDGLPPGALMSDEERAAMRSAGWLDSRDEATPKGMSVLRHVQMLGQQRAAAERQRKEAEQKAALERQRQAEQARQQARAERERQERKQQEERERQAAAERDRAQAEQERKQAEQQRQDAQERQRQERERRNEQMDERHAALIEAGWELSEYGSYEKTFTFKHDGQEVQEVAFATPGNTGFRIDCGREEKRLYVDEVGGREAARLIDQQAGEMAAKAAGVPQQARIADERTERPSTDSVDKPAPHPAQPAPTRQDAALHEKQALQPQQECQQQAEPTEPEMDQWLAEQLERDKEAMQKLKERRGGREARQIVLSMTRRNKDRGIGR